jgi:hypothetical protein
MTLSQSLTDLYESEDCCDLVVCYRGHRIPVHRAVLMSRCPQLSRHLTFAQGSEFNLRTPSYTVSLVIFFDINCLKGFTNDSPIEKPRESKVGD